MKLALKITISWHQNSGDFLLPEDELKMNDCWRQVSPPGKFHPFIVEIKFLMLKIKTKPPQ